MRRGVILLLVTVVLVVFSIWVSNHTYWTDMEIPTLPKGAARDNPFYAVQKFAESLGARAAWDRVLTVPPTDSVIVLSDWHWNLSDRRRIALERWVESGGRLIIEGRLLGNDAEFEQWSGIAREYRKEEPAQKSAHGAPHPCHKLREERSGPSAGLADSTLYWLCDFDEGSALRTTRGATWTLGGDQGFQAMRVPVGRGSVTVVNASPFQHRALFDGDHGRLFVTATELRRGDDMHFLSEQKRPSLLALLWLYGRPVVLLALVLIALALWRGSVRLGPLIVPSPSGRRSLAEQIRGTGRFALRHGGGEALHAACARALDEAAGRRVSGYQRLSANERAAALAELTGFDRNSLAAALYHPGLRRSHELRGTIELLEDARRRVMDRTRSTHGTS
jgi:hypothetical protein